MRVNPEFLRMGDLKKQTQFQNGQNDVKSVLIMCYGGLDGPWRRKNKANQSQFWGKAKIKRQKEK